MTPIHKQGMSSVVYDDMLTYILVYTCKMTGLSRAPHLHNPRFFFNILNFTFNFVPSHY